MVRNVFNALKTYTTMFLLFVSCLEASLSVCVIEDINKEAVKYVGNTNPMNGLKQLELLIREGATKEDYVLEIGCGALIAGIPIMTFLEQGHYYGIDPNKWLIDASLKVEENRSSIESAWPKFLYNENFDASSTGVTFDYIISHSIVSHAPLWQMNLFFENCSKVLRKGGKVIFSCRLTEANRFERISREESTTDLWQYPGNTFFKKETVIREALKWFSHVEKKDEYRDIIMSSDPSAFHEWFVLTK